MSKQEQLCRGTPAALSEVSSSRTLLVLPPAALQSPRPSAVAGVVAPPSLLPGTKLASCAPRSDPIALEAALLWAKQMFSSPGPRTKAALRSLPWCLLPLASANLSCAPECWDSVLGWMLQRFCQNRSINSQLKW